MATDDVINLMLSGKHETGCVVKNTEEYESYNSVYPNKLKTEVEYVSVDDAHSIFSNTWFMPAQYHEVDVLEYCLSRTSSKEEVDRVHQEYVLFQERNLIVLLRYFIYLVDTMKANNILWGVGRGSSVSSYILFLIGIHRINSIKYNLDITEFLK